MRPEPPRKASAEPAADLTVGGPGPGDVKGVAGISDDGSYVYFVAGGALALSSVAPAQAAPAAAPQQLVSIQSQSGKAATIAAAAKNQLGVGQDCTALVTKSLRAAGINHHGWPASYLKLGTRVSAAQAQPGDLVYYANGGKYVTGTWTKGAVNEVFQFTLDDGTPLKMAPGQTYVELPNLKAKVQIKD